MRKILLLLFCACCLMEVAVSQNTTAQQQQQARVLAEAQRKIDSIMKDPKLKQYMKGNQSGSTPGLPSLPPDLAQLAANPMAALAAPRKKDTAFLSHITTPPRNEKQLALIPAATLTRPQLAAWVKALKKHVIPDLQTHFGTEVVNTSAVGSTGASDAAALAWIRGRADVALELAIDGADIDPDDDIALNNLGSILTMCGMPFEAVPILDFIDRTLGDNPTVDNNLGQAWFGMGEIDKASAYLKRATAKSPYHPNANLTLAYIEYSHGNKAAAKEYCENALRGAYIPEAWTMLKSIDTKAELMSLIRIRYKQPDEFNPHKYPLPPQCRLAAEIKNLKPEYEAYRDMLISAKKRYQSLLKQEQGYIRDNLAKDVMKKVSNKQSPFPPFADFGIAVIGDLGETYQDKILKLAKYDSNYFRKMADLKQSCLEELKKKDESFKERADKAGEGNPDMNLEHDICMAENEVADKYLPQFADLTEARQQEWLNQLKDYYIDYAFWCRVAAMDEHQYNQMFDQHVLSFLTLLEKLATTEMIGCSGKFEEKPEESEFEFKEGKCPIDGEIPFANLGKHGHEFEGWIGKVDLDCEAFGLELGEGIIFNLDRKFNTGETTIALGLGETWYPPYCSPVEGSMKMQFYISFGGDHPVDIGIRWETEMDIKGMNKPENKAGWKVGVNTSGPHFDPYSEGPLPDALGGFFANKLYDLRPEAQVNPHVKIFNVNPGGAHKD